MNQDPTYWTARVAMLLYAGSLAAMLAGDSSRAVARWLYTAGCAALLIHIATAFELHHHWSHAAARAHVEQRTAEFTGVASGAGLWINYLFAVVWVADVAYWWIVGLDRYRRRSRWVGVLVHTFMIFIAVNATIVFSQGVSRLTSIAVGAVLVLLWARILGRRRHDDGAVVVSAETRST